MFRRFSPRGRAGALLLCAVAVLLAGTAVFSLYKLAAIGAAHRAAQRAFEQLLPDSSVSSGADSAAPVPAASGKQEPTRLQQLEPLFAEYEDMVGWLSIEGTRVDYPVMQTPDDPNYYLRRSLNGTYSEYGTPYLNGACSLTDSDNLIIYGHSMRSGDMFGSLLQYASAEYCREHPSITLYTRDGVRRYAVLGAFIIDVTPGTGDAFAYNDFISAGSEERYNDFLANVRQRAYYDTGIPAAYGTQLLTLSTCESTLPDGRFVVVAAQVE